MSEKITLTSEYFDEERIFDYVKKFKFPRLSGTEGERKAVDLTVKTFKDIGFKDERIEKEPFEFSDFYSTTLIQLMMIMCLTFYLVLLLLSYINPFITAGFIIMIILVVILVVRSLRHPEKGFWGEYFGTTYSSTNVIAKVPAREIPSEKAANLIISAHLDTKSQSLTTAWRIVLYRIWLFGGIVLGILYILYIFLGIFLNNLGRFSIFFQFSIWAATALVSFSNLMLMFLTTHNKSPGCMDNASGMSIVFELSSYFNEHPLDNLNLWFCQFSAEELGTMGSRHFVNNREHQFLKDKTFQINLDMISSAKHSPKKNIVGYLKSYGIFPRKIISPLLGKYLDESAEEENLFIKGFHLSTGAHTDSVPFHLRNYDAIDIVTKAGAKWAHSKKDTPDKVDSRILFKACKIIFRTILNLDKDYHELNEVRTSISKKE